MSSGSFFHSSGAETAKALEPYDLSLKLTGILRLQLTSWPPCWMTINKRILMSFIVPVIQHGRQGLCYLNLSGMVANHLSGVMLTMTGAFLKLNNGVSALEYR